MYQSVMVKGFPKGTFKSSTAFYHFQFFVPAIFLHKRSKICINFITVLLIVIFIL